MPSKVISGSTKVVNFGTNRKRVFDFLLVTNSNLCLYFAPFWRYGSLLVANRQFVPTPPSFNALARDDPLSNFGMNVISPETRMMGLPYGEEIMARMKLTGTRLFTVFFLSNLYSHTYIPFTYLLLTSFNHLHRLFN